MSTADVAVLGGGPVGAICALLMAQNSVSPILIHAGSINRPGRTIALMQPSITLLRQLGLWESLSAKATPLRAIRLVDDTRQLLRPPVVVFDANEIGLGEFGFNIANDDLQILLDKTLHERGVQVIKGLGKSALYHNSYVQLDGDAFSVQARVVIAASRQCSFLHELGGFQIKKGDYPQVAITALLSHEAEHHHISTEFHTRNGPLTFVPMKENTSSLVCVTSPQDSTYLMSLSKIQFCNELRQRSHSLLGAFTLLSEPSAWPLQSMLAHTFAQRRMILTGEAAHILPPIGAQGLNLGLRDAYECASLITTAIKENKDPGELSLLSTYNHLRMSDIELRGFAINQFNRSLLSTFLPVHFLRGLGLVLAQKSRFLRRKIMQAGIGELTTVNKPKPRLDTREHAT
jgi:2-octaprenyl-6-methoxyphenol hydroxylase